MFSELGFGGAENEDDCVVLCAGMVESNISHAIWGLSGSIDDESLGLDHDHGLG